MTKEIKQEQGELVSKKWIMRGHTWGIAKFDAEGLPLFYDRESFLKFKNGELSEPCKGKHCGSLNGWLHSAECHAEHEAHYTTPEQEQDEADDLTIAYMTGLYDGKKQAKQEQDEPVAYINVEQRKLEWAKYTSWETPTVVNLPKIPLYTKPQTKEWAGLNDEEKSEIYNINYNKYAVHLDIADFIMIYTAIEAKLKEKNT